MTRSSSSVGIYSPIFGDASDLDFGPGFCRSSPFFLNSPLCVPCGTPGFFLGDPSLLKSPLLVPGFTPLFLGSDLLPSVSWLISGCETESILLAVSWLSDFTISDSLLTSVFCSCFEYSAFVVFLPGFTPVLRCLGVGRRPAVLLFSSLIHSSIKDSSQSKKLKKLSWRSFSVWEWVYTSLILIAEVHYLEVNGLIHCLLYFWILHRM